MRERHITMEMFYGIALIVVCIVCVLVSVKLCEGDITPVFILIPIGVCALTGDNSKFCKEESKRRK